MMKKNNLAWFVVAGATIALSGVGMAACSSSSATGEPGGGVDASGGDTGNTGKDSGGSTDGGTGAECGSTPTLHATSAPDGGNPDIFCLTSGLYCAAETAHCCIPSAGTAGNPACADAGDTCPAANIDIQCDDTSECSGGQKCCALGDPGPTTIAGCPTYEKIFGFTGTKCAASCDGLSPDGGAAAEVCSKSTGCSDGSKTCTPAKEYVQIGLCL